MNKFLLSSIFTYSFLYLLLNIGNVQANCPGCTAEIPLSFPEDTLWLSDLPNGELGVFYSEDLSFRMPKTTDPVNAIDPGTPAGFTIKELTLLSITNMPLGLSWEAGQTVYDPSENTDGCLKFCGTPLQSGEFSMLVNVAAKVSTGIFEINQTTAFELLLIIEPSTSTTEGFSMTNNIACGSAAVSFQNNISSNSNDGFSYNWDFGNGNNSSTENPGTQLYEEPGVYEVSYEAVIDTAGYFLTNIKVLTSECNDIFNGAPDMRIRVYDPDENILFETPTFDNTWPPVEASLFLTIGDGNYQIEVEDDDSGLNLNDDLCGLVNFNKFTTDVIFSTDGFSVELTIQHPITTIQSVDSVYVYEIPESPSIDASAELPICQGDSLWLETNYTENIQWYRDSVLLINEINPFLFASNPGLYRVEYTSEEGCVSSSDWIEVSSIPAPASPAYVNENNLLTLFDPDALPVDYTLQWYQNGVILEGETGLSYCISEFGTYTLLVEDLSTGCFNSFTLTVPYNSNVSCDLSPTEELFAGGTVNIFPNPTSGKFDVNITGSEAAQIDIQVRDILGQILFQKTYPSRSSFIGESFDLTSFPNGMYLISISADNESIIRKVIKSDE